MEKAKNFTVDITRATRRATYSDLQATVGSIPTSHTCPNSSVGRAIAFMFT